MTTFLVTLLMSFLLLLLVIAGMSIGVMHGRGAIKGSCGGLNGGGCDLCSGSCEERETRERER